MSPWYSGYGRGDAGVLFSAQLVPLMVESCRVCQSHQRWGTPRLNDIMKVSGTVPQLNLCNCTQNVNHFKVHVAHKVGFMLIKFLLYL